MHMTEIAASFKGLPTFFGSNTTPKKAPDKRKIPYSFPALPILTNQEENALITRAQNGETQARQRLLEGYIPLILHTIRQYRKDDNIIGDLIQEVILKLNRAIDNKNTANEVPFRPYAMEYIHGIIKRILLQEKKKMHVSYEQVLEDLGETESEHPLPCNLPREEINIDELCERMDLNNALSQLKPNQRFALIQASQGFAEIEIAQNLAKRNGRSYAQQTIHYHLTAARKKMQKILTENKNPSPKSI